MNKISLYFKLLSSHKKLILLWFLGLLILCIIPAFLAILYVPIDPDSAYYLSIIERINDGFIPYKDINIGYTPLVFYMMLVLKNIFSIGINYEFYLTAYFGFQFLCGYYIYKISYLLLNRKDFAFYAAVLFIITSHWLDGNVFLLETPSLFFGLISVYLTLKYPTKIIIFVGIGVLASLSFLSKQYGLGFLGLIVYMICFNKKKWGQFVCLLIGFLFPIIVCFFIWGDSFSIIVLGEYGIHETILQDLNTVVDRAGYFIYRIFPVLFIGVFYLIFILKNSSLLEIRNITMLIFGILGFMLQFYFAPFNHYYLYIIPFASILSFLILSRINQLKWFYSIFLISTVLLSIYSTYYNCVYKIYYKHQETKKNQYILAKEILKSVDRSKTLYVVNIMLIPQYYLTNMIPPNIKSTGYTFGQALNKQSHLNQIKKASYILKYKINYNEYGLNTLDVENELMRREIININKEIILYK